MEIAIDLLAASDDWWITKRLFQLGRTAQLLYLLVSEILSLLPSGRSLRIQTRLQNNFEYVSCPHYFRQCSPRSTNRLNSFSFSTATFNETSTTNISNALVNEETENPTYIVSHLSMKNGGKKMSHINAIHWSMCTQPMFLRLALLALKKIIPTTLFYSMSLIFNVLLGTPLSFRSIPSHRQTIVAQPLNPANDPAKQTTSTASTTCLSLPTNHDKWS
jgi:hypothetical protein